MKTEAESFSQICVSRTILLSYPFWYRKRTTDVRILAHINIGLPDDGYPELKIYVPGLILDS